MKSTGNKAVIGILGLMFSLSVEAVVLKDTSVFDNSDNVITFDEFNFQHGDAIDTQYLNVGVEFSPSLRVENYRSVRGFSERSAANFFPNANPFQIIFSELMDAFGAYWEFNLRSETVFKAFLGGLLVDSFLYIETDCCNTGTFLGFTDIIFDAVQIEVGKSDTIFDNLYYSTNLKVVRVPEPSVLILFFFALLILSPFIHRKNKQRKLFLITKKER